MKWNPEPGIHQWGVGIHKLGIQNPLCPWYAKSATRDAESVTRDPEFMPRDPEAYTRKAESYTRDTASRPSWISLHEATSVHDVLSLGVVLTISEVAASTLSLFVRFLESMK